MTIPEDSQRKIDAYLDRLRRCLHDMREEDAREIVAELRSHILDKAEVGGTVTPAGIDSALAGLGPAEALAGEYLTNDLLARAQASRSPWLVLRGLFRWASLSIAGFLILVPSLLGYILGVAFAWAAIFKPFHPQATGLWVITHGEDYDLSLHMGFGAPPTGGHEVLGWWIIPLGIGLGCAVVLLTLHIDLWFLGTFRRRRPMPIS